ncbi:MAG: alanine racemase [Patescibacteria group bacterium]
MVSFIKKILKPKYETLNEVQIISNNLISNLKYLQSQQEKSEMFPVLKSNAYGHGLKEVCKILNKTNTKMVAVDSFPEAQIVYKNFKGKVLILGEMPLDVYKYCNFKRTEFIIYNTKTLKHISRFKKRAKVHLFVNTGMNREGIDDLNLFIENNKKYIDKIEITGVCSHLAEADNQDSNFTKSQEEKFAKALNILKVNKIYPKWVHIGNSSSIFNLKNDLYTAFRPGLALYGYNPLKETCKMFSEANKALKPALRLYSTVISTHKIKGGDKVSYSNSFIAKEDTTIAVIPFGYYEGLDRRFSNCTKFLFNDKKGFFWGLIAGKVCMNITCINCFNREVSVGDRVQIFSELKDAENSIENMAKKIDVITYEILTSLKSNIKKKVV